MTYIFTMIKHKLEKITVINKIVPDFMDTLYYKQVLNIVPSYASVDVTNPRKVTEDFIT